MATKDGTRIIPLATILAAVRADALANPEAYGIGGAGGAGLEVVPITRTTGVLALDAAQDYTINLGAGVASGLIVGGTITREADGEGDPPNGVGVFLMDSEFANVQTTVAGAPDGSAGASFESSDGGPARLPYLEAMGTAHRYGVPFVTSGGNIYLRVKNTGWQGTGTFSVTLLVIDTTPPP